MAKDMYQKREERKKKALENNENNGVNKSVINWFPGHMAKTKKEISEIISSIDVVIEVVDARIPYSSSIPDLNTYTRDKTMLMVFSKYDLCDRIETDKWKKYYTDKGYCVVTCNSKNTSDYKNIISTVNNLMKTVNEKRKLKGLLPKKAKCLVVGVPNVGKSTLINRLVNKKISVVGNKPGVTKTFQTIRINEYLELVDTPGILWPKIATQESAYNLGSMTIIKEEILPINEVACHILKKLNDYYKPILKNQFNLDEFDINDVEHCYEVICKCKNIPVNGDIDFERISTLILNHIKQEKIVGITFDRVK